MLSIKLPEMDSHHRHPVPETGVLLLNYPANFVPGRNCTCGLKVRSLAFCLLNYGDIAFAKIAKLSKRFALNQS